MGIRGRPVSVEAVETPRDRGERPPARRAGKSFRRELEPGLGRSHGNRPERAFQVPRASAEVEDRVRQGVGAEQEARVDAGSCAR